MIISTTTALVVGIALGAAIASAFWIWILYKAMQP